MAISLTNQQKAAYREAIRNVPLHLSTVYGVRQITHQLDPIEKSQIKLIDEELDRYLKDTDPAALAQKQFPSSHAMLSIVEGGRVHRIRSLLDQRKTIEDRQFQ